MITYYLQQDDYEKALAVMVQQTDPKVYYENSPTLMALAPFETVSAWILQCVISPRRQLLLVSFSSLPVHPNWTRSI